MFFTFFIILINKVNSKTKKSVQLFYLSLIIIVRKKKRENLRDPPFEKLGALCFVSLKNVGTPGLFRIKYSTPLGSLG